MTDLPVLLLGPATTAVAGAALMGAAAHDIAERRIPNAAVATIGAAALLVLLGESAGLASWHVGLAAAWLLLALPLFVWGQLGGGDVKLMAVLLLWAGPGLLAPFLLLLSLATFATAASLLVWRGAGGPSPLRGLPFGLPLAMAGLPILLSRSGQWPGFA